MPRVHFDALKQRTPDCLELVVPRPRDAPRGYTPVIWLIEQLTLGCRGDWACRAEGRRVRLRFADAADHRRALAGFDAPVRAD